MSMEGAAIIPVDICADMSEIYYLNVFASIQNDENSEYIPMRCRVSAYG